MAEETIFDTTLSLKRNGDVAIWIQGEHGYTAFSGSEPWNMRINLDGSDIKSVGGASVLENIVYLMGAKKGLGAGDHSLKVFWYGSTNMRLVAGTDLVTMVRYR